MKRLHFIAMFLALVAGASSQASQYSAAVLADNPFAYYRLDEADNSLPATDEKSANNGVYINSATVGVTGAIATDAVSTAAAFSSSASQYVQLTTLGSFGSGMTTGFAVEYWLRAGNSTTYQAILGAANSGGFNTDFLVDIAYGGNAGRLRLYFRDDSYDRYEANCYPAGGNVNIYDNAWHHLVQVYDPSAGTLNDRVIFYVDGVRQTATVTLGGVVPSSSNFNESVILGGFNSRGTVQSFLQGSLDEVAFYQAPLSLSQVLNHYRAAVGAAQGGNAQTITFPAITAKQSTDAPFTLSASASSGLAVSFSITAGSDVATISGNTVTLTGFTGQVTVRASQNGNGTYAAAVPVDRTFTVACAPFLQLATNTIQSQGSGYTIGIRVNGTLWATGGGGNGELANGSTGQVHVIQQIGSVNTWQSISAGADHVVAIRSDGTLWAWGFNSSGQLGDGTQTQRTTPVQVPGTNWKVAVAGQRHTVAVKGDGTLWAWGSNANGQLGQGTTDTIPHSSPVQIGPLTTWGQNIASLSAGLDFTVALQTDGTLWAWGLNSSGQLGDSSTTLRTAPVQIGTATNWSSVSAAAAFSVGKKSDGTFWVWGGNASGQLGDGTTTQRNSPTAFTALANVLKMRPGGTHMLAIKSDGTLWAWGSNSIAQLGLNSVDTAAHTTPAQVGTASDWQDVIPGFGQSIATKMDGTVWAWGSNASGQLGYVPRVALPMAPGFGATVLAGAGQNDTIALRADGTLWTWGSNGNGQLGLGTSDALPHRAPVQVGVGVHWQHATAGVNYLLAVNFDGTLWGCGANSNGQLGDDSSTQRNSLTQIGSDNQWRTVSGGGNFSLGVKADGTLWAWGNNDNGQLGDGTTNQRLSPGQVGTDTNWKAAWAATSDNYSIALKTDGTLWAWGKNANGQLGDGTTNQRLTPAQIGSATWLTAAIGARCVLAIMSDGTLWAWGSNTSGALGDGTTTQRLSPVKIGNDNRWTSVASGNAHSLATKSDGTLWSWGVNSLGQLGDGTLVNRNAPAQVGNSGAWVSAQPLCGSSHSLVLTADGTLWGFGGGNNGQIGLAGHNQWLPDGMLPFLSSVQAISLSAPPSISQNTSATIGATTTSGLPATFLVSGPATLAGDQLTVTGPGMVTLIAYQPGDGFWQSSDVALQYINPAAPTAMTFTASAVGATSATLNGGINPNGIATAAKFQVGSTASYGTDSPVNLVPANASVEQPASVALTGLAAGTTYHFRVTAANEVGATNGADSTFTTAFTPQAWRAKWYGTTNNTGNAADTADPYHTGVQNLVVYALLGPSQNPAQVLRSQLPSVQKINGNLVYSFTEPAGVSGVAYGAEWTEDLSSGTWMPVSDTGSGTTHTFSIPMIGHANVFFRVKITAP